MPESVAGPCFQTPEVAKKQIDPNNYDEMINTLTQERDAARDALRQQGIEESARLVVSCDSPAEPNTPEFQLLEAAVRIANCFLATSLAHNALTEVGVSAAVLQTNKIKIIFLDPCTSFDNCKVDYAYAWIDPKKYDAYTIIMDSSILSRYAKIWKTSGGAAEAERDRIEWFVALKFSCHELGHLGFRWTNPKYLFRRTPAHVFGGESGRLAETQIAGGELGLIHKGPRKWTGMQKLMGLHVNNVRIREDYIRRVCSECRREAPQFSSLLPVQTCGTRYQCKRGEYILSSPSTQSAAVDDAFDAAGGEIPWRKDSFLIPGGRCGLRFWPKPVALFEAWDRRLRPRPARRPEGPAPADEAPPAGDRPQPAGGR
jgi:hypothetical protein